MSALDCFYVRINCWKSVRRADVVFIWYCIYLYILVKKIIDYLPILRIFSIWFGFRYSFFDIFSCKDNFTNLRISFGKNAFFRLSIRSLNRSASISRFSTSFLRSTIFIARRCAFSALRWALGDSEKYFRPSSMQIRYLRYWRHF